MIGYVILFHLEKNRFNLVGRPSVHNWVQYHCETGKYDVRIQRDERTVVRPGRIGTEGVPLSGAGTERDSRDGRRSRASRFPTRQFFNMTDFQIAGRRVRALRHGMVGQPGFELFGPWDYGEAVKAAIIEAGQEFGLRQSGARTYLSNTLNQDGFPHRFRRSIQATR